VISRLRQLVSRQLSQPSGAAGRVVAVVMNRGNRRMNTRAIELLDLEDGTRVLDLGFGGGLALDMLLDRGAQVEGVDRAPAMVAAATTRHRDAIAAGRLTVTEGDVTALPLPADSVDGVVTINTVYFWPDLAAALAEIMRVLTPDGKLVIGIRDGSVMNNVSRDIFTIRPPAEIKTRLAEAGFDDVQIDSPSDQKVHYIVAQRSPKSQPVVG
jgi:arsenite methyltransferase